MTLEELRAIAAIVKKYPRCWVISDEIYSQLIYDKALLGPGGCAPSFLEVSGEVPGAGGCAHSFLAVGMGYCVCSGRKDVEVRTEIRM
jgi:aspartate/methionine/tyrosine aminotransferase